MSAVAIPETVAAPPVTTNDSAGTTPTDDKGSWASILGAVRSPLTFFALALLIIEASFTTLYGLSAHTAFELELVIGVSGGLTLAVVAAVAVLTKFAGSNLVEEAAQKAANNAAQKVVEQQKAQIRAVVSSLDGMKQQLGQQLDEALLK